MSVGTSSPNETADAGLAARLRGFGGVGIGALLIIFLGALVWMPVAAALILAWAWCSRTPRDEIGLARPRSWIGGALVGAVLGVTLKFAMKAIVLPLLGAPAVPHNVLHDQAIRPLDALSLAAYTIYGGGFAEELFFRGYLFERIGKLVGRQPAATLAALVVSTGLFSAGHWQQGGFGMIHAAFTGVVLGSVYLIAGRKLWVAMVTHAAFDLASVALIYFNLEAQVAHLVFR